MDALWQDLCYAVRILTRHRGFAALGVIVLALGFGVSTAVFSLVNAVLFRPLPVAEADRLVWIYTQTTARPDDLGTVSSKDLLRLQRNADVFAGAASFMPTRPRLGVDGFGQYVTGETVSSSYFTVLGIRPTVGRVFSADEDRRDSPPVVVISERLWRGRFRSASDILGRQVSLDTQSERSRPYTIVGVAPASFKGLMSAWDPSDVWIPSEQRVVDYAAWCYPPNFMQSWGFVVARLKSGVTPGQARMAVHEAAIVAQREDPKNPQEFPDWTLVALESKRSDMLPFGAGSYRVVPERLATALMAVCGLLLLIASANLTGVLLARGVVRKGEIAVRLALGAGHLRIARQLLIESLMLAAAGSLAGLWLSRLLVGLFLSSVPSQFGMFGTMSFVDVALDLHVVLFGALTAVAAALMVSVGPALQVMRAHVVSPLTGEKNSRPVHQRAALQYLVVVPQVCLALVLLLGAGLLIRGLLNYELKGLGYRQNAIAFIDFETPTPSWCGRLGLAPTSAAEAERRAQRRHVNDLLLDGIRRVSSIRAAGMVANPSRYVVDNREHSWVESTGEAPVQRWVSRADVSPGFFDTLEIPLIGRDFNASDTSESPDVAIVSELLAAQLWPGRSALGATLTFHPPNTPRPSETFEVIGIVKEVRSAVSNETVSPTVYLPVARTGYASSVLVRGGRSWAEIVTDVSAVMRGADASINITASGTLSGVIDEIQYPRRLATLILSTAGLIGVLLAALGLYGVVSFSVAQRVREFGIRAALGANRSDLFRLVLNDATRVLLIGAVVGIPLSLAAIRVATATVVGVPQPDILTFVIVPMLLALVILLACYVPARRAARVDPMVALREL